MKKLIILVLMLSLGGIFGGCWAKDKLKEVGTNWIINVADGELNGISEEYYAKLKAYLELLGLDIKDLDKDGDGKITQADLKNIPGVIMMNPKAATDWKFWEMLMIALLPSYGHRALRRFGLVPNADTVKKIWNRAPQVPGGST